jgi:hypothetical protein
VTSFVLVFALLFVGFGGMALGRLWGREPLRSCGRCEELPCPACPARRRGDASASREPRA